MSVDTTMAVLYAQSGLSTNVANAAMVAPQASLALSRVLAAEAARQERLQVEKSEKSENPNINKDGHENRQMHGRLRNRRKHSVEDPEPFLFSTPFTGNLLNMKI